MRFLVDEQLPSALARWIAVRGHEAEHVFDVGLGGADDVEIWRHAKKTNATIITTRYEFLLRKKVLDFYMGRLND